MNAASLWNLDSWSPLRGWHSMTRLKDFPGVFRYGGGAVGKKSTRSPARAMCVNSHARNSRVLHPSAEALRPNLTQPMSTDEPSSPFRGKPEEAHSTASNCLMAASTSLMAFMFWSSRQNAPVQRQAARTTAHPRRLTAATGCSAAPQS